MFNVQLTRESTRYICWSDQMTFVISLVSRNAGRIHTRSNQIYEKTESVQDTLPEKSFKTDPVVQERSLIRFSTPEKYESCGIRGSKKSKDRRSDECCIPDDRQYNRPCSNSDSMRVQDASGYSVATVRLLIV